MKRILSLLFTFSVIFTFAQNNSDVVGQWYNAEKDAIITIFEDNNNLSGKITWMLNPNDKNGNPKTDPLNPNKELRERPRLGMVIMKDFAYQKDNIWDEGTLYDPKKGKTYSGKITLKDKNTLDLRGYIGVPALGRSSTWTRANDGSAE